jgi:hypothetical protein
MCIHDLRGSPTGARAGDEGEGGQRCCSIREPISAVVFATESHRLTQIAAAEFPVRR